MYVVIRKFKKMASVREAARRAQTGIGPMLKGQKGFRGYYVFDAGEGAGGSITLFDDQQSALAAHEKSLTWIRASMADLVQGEPDVTFGEVVVIAEPDE